MENIIKVGIKEIGRVCGVDDVDEVRLCQSPAATNGHIFCPSYDILLWSSGGMILTREAEEVGEDPVPVPLCPPGIPHDLTRAQTRTSIERGRRLAT
jgi:hypothetical protein